MRGCYKLCITTSLLKRYGEVLREGEGEFKSCFGICMPGRDACTFSFSDMSSQVPSLSSTFIDLKGKIEAFGKPPCRLTIPGISEKLKMNLLRLLKFRALPSLLR